MASAPGNIDDQCGHCRGIVRCSTCGRPPAVEDSRLCAHCGNPIARHPMAFKVTFKSGVVRTLTCDGDATAAVNARRPRTYQTKSCRLCTATFTPTGARDTDCAGCKATRNGAR